LRSKYKRDRPYSVKLIGEEGFEFCAGFARCCENRIGLGFPFAVDKYGHKGDRDFVSRKSPIATRHF
jgi:hypothetical protein